MARYCPIFLLLLASCAGRVARTPAPANSLRVNSVESAPEKEDSYAEAAEFYLLRRVGEGRELPVERLLEARRHAQQMPRYSIAQQSRGKSTSRNADIGAWKQLGPGNIGGRTRSFAIHPNDPNIIWAGAVGGGVWKTTDGGASWNPLTDLLPSIGISSLALDPKNPDTIYAGTGEWYTGSLRGDSIRGVGIYKSTDGGLSWTQLPQPNATSFYYINKIVVSPHDGNRIYAATYGGLWSSSNGGQSWTLSLNRTSPNSGCQDLAIRTDQAQDYLFASCLSSGTGVSSAVFRNVDAGGAGKWESVLAPQFMGRTSLAIAPSNQGIVYAMAASLETGANAQGLLAVYRSSSNGDTGSWETRASSKDTNRLNKVLLTNPREAFADVCSSGTAAFNNQGNYDNALAVDPLNPDVVWAGGIDVFRSDDGGGNWGIAGFWQATAPQLVHADNHQFLFSPNYDGNGNQTLLVVNDGGVFRTDNALAPTATGDRAACSPYPTQVVWTNLNNGYAATQFYHGAVYPGGAAYIAGAQDNGTSVGNDAEGFNGWRKVNGGDGGTVAIDPNDSNLVYAETTNLALVRSTNGGVSFSSATRGINEASANFLFIAPYVMDPSNSKRLYLGGQTLWRTIDGAANWTEASAPIGAANGSISAIAVSPNDPNRGLIGTSTGSILRSTTLLTNDKTAVWQSVLPRSGYVSRIAYDPSDPNVAYATYSQYKTLASQSHVYKTIDGGATWTGIDGTGATSIPDIPVFALLVDPRNSSTLYVGSDIGLFVSIDGGATWSRDDNPFADAVTEVLAIAGSGDDKNLYAFTHGRGVWKTTLPGSGSPCQYDVSPADAVNVNAYGGTTFTLNVTAADGCVWSAVPAVATVSSPATGKGSGKVTVSVGQNLTVLPRAGKVSIQDKVVQINQDAALSASGNDDVATPFDLGTLPSVALQNTTSATSAESDPVHSCTKSADSNTVWYSLTANDTGILRVLYYSSRIDTGTDSGTVLAVYDAATSKELACSILPQSTSLFTKTVSVGVTQGQQLLVEVSATLSGTTAANAVLQGGSLRLTAQIVKP